MGKSGREDVVAALVAFTSSFEGYHARETARILRRTDARTASRAFLDVLGDPDQKRIWSVAIEALEELNIPNGPDPANSPDRVPNNERIT